MRYKLLLIVLLLGCKPEQKANTSRLAYDRWVGDIKFDKSKDSDLFKLCNDDLQTYQYFNDGNGLEYEGEKKAISEAFETHFVSKQASETGLVRIRFIVNCKGQTGRFRLLGMDKDYKEKEFHVSITNQLLTIAKSLDKWRPKFINEEPVDYYQYLIIKMENGKILEILP